MKTFGFPEFGIFIVVKNPLGMIIMLLCSFLIWDLVESTLAKFGKRRRVLSLVRFRPEPQIEKQ